MVTRLGFALVMIVLALSAAEASRWIARYGNANSGTAIGPPPPPATAVLLLQNGTDDLLLENGAGNFLCLEGGC